MLSLSCFIASFELKPFCVLVYSQRTKEPAYQRKEIWTYAGAGAAPFQSLRQLSGYQKPIYDAFLFHRPVLFVFPSLLQTQTHICGSFCLFPDSQPSTSVFQ